MPSITPSLASLRRQVNALKRKFARVLAAYRLRLVANRIVELWNIAVAKTQPVPDPIDCVHIVADAGFRPKSWNPLHAYIRNCRRYDTSPAAEEIINRLIPPKQRVNPSTILANRSSAT